MAFNDLRRATVNQNQNFLLSNENLQARAAEEEEATDIKKPLQNYELD